MVVGDDAQAIYAFRSATVANILEFPSRFPGTTVVKLERNYRSTRPILEATNAVIALSPQRHEKTLWTERVGGPLPSLLTCIDERDQADAVCRSILDHRERGTHLREQAVLFRAGHHSDLLEVELTRRNIPFVKYGGLKFLESAHVKDALAVLRIADNPRDEVSWFRVLQLLDHVGPAGARRVMAAIGVSAPGDPMTRFLEQAIAVPAPARSELDHLRTAFRDLAVEGAPPPLRSSGCGGSSSHCSAGATTNPSPGCAISSSSSSWRPGSRPGRGSSPTSRWTHPSRPRIWLDHRTWTRTTWSCRRSIPPRVASGTSST